MNWNIIKAGPRMASGATSPMYKRQVTVNLTNPETNKDAAKYNETLGTMRGKLDDGSRDDAGRGAVEDHLTAEVVVDGGG
jgi:hypothetical protein